MYFTSLNDQLHHCWWCGEHPRVATNEYYEQKDDSVFIKCAKCGTRTTTLSYKGYNFEKTAKEVLELWNSGVAKIPLTVCLPHNHYVLERVLTKRTTVDFIYRASKMSVIVPNKRNISHHLKTMLVAVLEGDTPKPHEFRLWEYNTLHNGTKLLEIKKYDFNHTEFVFETKSSTLNLGENKTDTAWLKKEPDRPPIFDKIFNILSD